MEEGKNKVNGRTDMKHEGENRKKLKDIRRRRMPKKKSRRNKRNEIRKKEGKMKRIWKIDNRKRLDNTTL